MPHVHNCKSEHFVPQKAALADPQIPSPQTIELGALPIKLVMAEKTVRTKLARFTENQLRDALNETWLRRVELEKAAAAITEEILSRTILEHFPQAHSATLVEDNSHDSPHGHLYTIMTADGTILVRGDDQNWHNHPLAPQIDEYIYDLYPLIVSKFTYDKNRQKRLYTFSLRNDTQDPDSSSNPA